MKRYALLLIAAFLVAAPLAHAAATPLFSSDFHIVPNAQDIDPLCPEGAPLSYGAVLELIHRFMNVGVSVGIVVCTLIIMWAGILLITSSTNPEAKSTARKMLGNAALGLLIILSSWLIVDFVMRALYSGEDGTKGKFGPWNSILNGGAACVIARPNQTLFSGSITAAVPVVNTIDPGYEGPGTSDGHFTYQAGIQAQKSAASPKLNALLTCMASRVPRGVGQISSISDNQIQTGKKSFQQCAASGCAHAAHSCHYGGKTCIGSSYAVDFGDEQNTATLTAAARACGATYVGNEGNHLHVSVGASCGCN